MDNKQWLRVWNVINPPSPATFYNVESIIKAKEVIERLTNEQLENPDIISNAFGLQVYERGGWIEYYDDEGRDIEALLSGD